MLLHLLSVIDMLVVTGASWCFGSFISGFCSDGKKIRLVIAVTTILAAVASTCHLWFLHVSQMADNSNSNHHSSWILFGIASITGAVTTWTGEWSFLPSVVLATVSLDNQEKNNTNDVSLTLETEAMGEEEQYQSEYQSFLMEEEDDDDDHHHDRNAAQDCQHTAAADRQKKQQGVQYGSYISCIDFGDQLGALAVGALVSTMGITRENDWDHMDHFICLCALLSASSLVFLILLQ